MNYTSIFAAALAAAALLPGVTRAQSPDADDDDVRIMFVRTARDTVVAHILKDGRPVEKDAIPVPHFAIKTSDNKFIMTIGGQLNTIVGVDMGNDLYAACDESADFVTSSIPVPPLPGHKSAFFINPFQSVVDMQVVGLGGTDDQITGYIKIGTNGSSSALKIKKAYLSWRGFTAGLKSTLFKDGDACQPPTIDPQGPPGTVSETVYEVCYETPRYRGFKAGVGVDIPTYYASSGRYHGHDYQSWEGKDIVGQVVCDPEYYSQNVPDIPLYVEWKHSDNNRIRLSGIVRTFNYRDLLENKRRDTVGWGIMLSGNYSPVKPLIFYLQAVYGKGIGAYIQDMQGLPLSFTPQGSHPGKMTPTPMMGFNFGLTYNISPKWQVNAVVSESRYWSVKPYAIDATVDPGNKDNYKWGVYGAANVFYNISSYLQVGLEYIYGHRKPWGMGGSSDNRLQTQFCFTI